ncbi:MAG: MMPL family transporter [Oscillospiraceae bacterium]|nr:MMPL family transporter [Oscillospiraceae bacterium]
MIDSDSQQSIARLAMFSDKQKLTETKTSTELAAFLGMDEQMVDGMIAVYNMQLQMQELPEIETLSVKDFINLAMQMETSSEAGLDEATMTQLTFVQILTDAVVSEKDFTALEMYELIGSLSPTLTENTIELMYLMQKSSTNSDSEWELSLLDFIGYINNDILNDSRFDGLISDKMKASIEEIYTQLEDGAAQLKGDNYSRIIFSTTLPEEFDETTAFINDLTEMSDAGLQNDYYLIGSSAMNYEMANSFESELHTITLLTILAIFLIVAISFRNLIIPIILVLLVQCGVYITVSVLHFVGVYPINIAERNALFCTSYIFDFYQL